MISALQPPEWMIDELQNRVVLFLNHVLIQEPQAQDRLRRQVGKPVRMQWGEIHLTLAATPAGLVERV
ncbi:MAG: ubiquinone biosynthesis accessory factor UbiJ, partial [Betaproteobacteria bacterium]|nr:ubiquinone biosynthesis accessory factor UbiJ [Betaproteobacteria bacterium]